MHRTAIRLVALLAPLALASIAGAASTVTITKTHLCCKSCVNGVAKAVKTVDGATAKCDQDAQTIVVTAPDDATAQKAVDAIAAAGYYGSATGAKLVDDSGAKAGAGKNVEVSGIHNCCKKCTTAINDVIKKAGGTGEAKAKATTFAVSGVDEVKLVEAFNEAGFSVKVAEK